MVGKLSRIKLSDYKPLGEVIFDTLREAIIMGELKPGERLMEVHLAEKMGVSRTPVREAIRKLELEGLVTMVPRKGAFVSTISPKDIIDVLEIRASLDGLATALSAERIKDSELKDLENIQNQFIESVQKENLNGAIKKDVEFHDVIYRSSRNDRLIQLANNLREQIQRFRVIYLKDYGSNVNIVSEHASIFDAISRRDSHTASRLAIEHIKHQETAIVGALNSNLL
ncbi:MAG: GntR family transcriptional regulator [Eubacteriales bacterium]|nr:GntR family transcriptional regulator [Eubacteriales bacterium]